MLERHGLVLVPAESVEYLSILIDAPEEGRVEISLLEDRERVLKRVVEAGVFVRILEEALSRKRKRRRRKT